MANYNLVVNSKFQPFSFERYIQPYQMYGEAYKEVENALGELATKASVWEEMANEQTDPYAYKMYKSYADDLNAQADLLAKEGLNATSRRGMLNMRARYSKEITPIEQAYTLRQKQAEEQQKALLQDPTLMLSRRASTTSLDDYIRNPQLAYEAYSGKLLTAQAAQAAGALSKEMRSNPRKWRSILGDSYYETMMQKGFSSDAVLQAVQGNPEAARELTSIVEDAISSSGVRNWGDQATLDRAYDYARQGLWSAVGETQYQTLDNWRAKMDETDRRKVEQATQARLNSLAINPLNIYSSREQTKADANIREFSKYFEKDTKGNTILSKLGEEELRKQATKSYSHSRQEDIVTTSAFSNFLTELGVVDNTYTKNIGKLWDNYLKEHDYTKYDATRVTEFDYPIAGAQQGDMKDAIMTAGRGLSLKEVDYDSKSKQFKDTGEEITMEDLKSDKYKVTATRFSPYGTTVMVQDDKGNVRRYRMPAGINTTNEQNRDRAMSAANKWQQVVSTGQYTDARGNIHYATPDEITYAQQQYAQAIQQAYLYHSQLGVQNKTKEQEFNPYGY